MKKFFTYFALYLFILMFSVCSFKIFFNTTFVNYVKNPKDTIRLEIF